MIAAPARRTLPFALVLTAALAQAPPPRTNETNVPAVPPKKGEAVRPLTAGDLTAFVDGMLPIQLDRSDEAGAVVVVVRDNDVLLDKGYGYSDVEKKIPVDPAVTGFRPGSISKLFTWISVMQLKEQNKLALDTDVNRYIDFRIADRWGRPVTIRDLMTHRAGFEEEFRDLIRSGPPLISLRQYLIENQPGRVFPPGTIPAYSNYGAGLAGYIVQRVSKERFEDYVRRHIFEPLGMSHSTFEQPLPRGWPVHPAAGYAKAESKMMPFEIVNPAPAGGLTTTGADMIRFARALMYGGELDGHRILNEATLQEMWAPQFRANPELPAMCLGFYEQVRDGTRWIGHAGDLIAYHSLFGIQPESRTAIFLSYNTAGTGRGVGIERQEFLNQFIDRYYGPAKTPAAAPKQTGTRASEVAGSWWATRRGITNRIQFLNLLDQRKASSDREGRLVVSDAESISGETIHWQPAGRDLWVYPDGQQYLAAIRDGSGRIARLAFTFPAIQLERVPWYATTRLNVILLGCSLFALAAVLWAAGLRIVQRRQLKRADPIIRRLRRAQQLASIAWLVLLASVMAINEHFSGPGTFPPGHEFDKWFLVTNIIVVVAMIASAWMWVVVMRVWHRLPPGILLRLRTISVLSASVFLIWFSVYWKLIGPVSRY